MSQESSEPSDGAPSALLVIYQIAHEQWEHAEQLRWTVLYNFLVASTILLLAWGAVFETRPASLARTFVLLTFCLVGAFVSIVWVGLETRANKFVRHHSVKAKEIEASLPQAWHLFSATERFRSGLKGSERWIATRRAVLFVPSTFFIMFVILGCLSLGNEVLKDMGMGETAIAWATVVNAVLVSALVGVTVWYAIEASKARKAAERQAAASEASLRALRHEAELQAGLSRTIVKTAMQTAVRNIEYWEPEGKAYNLAIQYQLPKDVELLPPNAHRAVEQARGISVEGSEELSSAFDSLRLAQLQLQILRDAKQTSPQFYQSNASQFLGYLREASLALSTAQASFHESREGEESGRRPAGWQTA